MLVNTNVSSALAGLDELGEDLYSVTRTMSYEVAYAVYEQAYKNVNPGPTGLLRSALYTAFSSKSTGSKLTYTVSWNRKTAPHGHLVEYGHWQTHRNLKLPNGRWVKAQDELPRDEWTWTPAHSFLRKAYDTVQSRFLDIATEAGRKRFEELRSKR